MERVDGKEGAYHGTSPDRSRHPRQDEKEQKGIADMKEQIVEMVPLGVQPIKLAVQHVGNPRQRVPVAGMGRSKGPPNTIRGQARTHMGILNDVFIIVI